MMQSYSTGCAEKRHSSVYDTAGAISEAEAEFAVGQAEHLMHTIETLLKKI